MVSLLMWAKVVFIFKYTILIIVFLEKSSKFLKTICYNVFMVLLFVLFSFEFIFLKV
jgi:hypothetical protein